MSDIDKDVAYNLSWWNILSSSVPQSTAFTHVARRGT